MSDELHVVPALTSETAARDLVTGQDAIVNGTIDVRKTHPNLWRSVMLYASVNMLLGLNFLVLQPTFLIYDQSNYLWGVIFLAAGLAKVVFLNFYRSLRNVRLTMAFEVSFMFFIALGATQPFLEGEGSLQLPILYVGMALLELPMLIEPFVNPWTARRD